MSPISNARCTFCGEEPHPLRECPACLGEHETRAEYLQARKTLAALRDELEKARDALKVAEDLICHAEVHAAYSHSGWSQMSTAQKDAWQRIWRKRVAIADAEEEADRLAIAGKLGQP